MANWKCNNIIQNLAPIGGNKFNFSVNPSLEIFPNFLDSYVHPLYIKGIPFYNGWSIEGPTPTLLSYLYDYNGSMPMEHSGFNLGEDIIPDWNCIGFYEKNSKNYSTLLPQLEGDSTSFFAAINPIGANEKEPFAAATCLKPAGFGSGFGMPFTPYDSSKWPDNKKPVWKAITIGPIKEGGEQGFDQIRYAVRDRLNSVELKDLHPIQIKVSIRNNAWGGEYSATIFYTRDYPNTAPHTFVNGDNNMILPYCNTNGHGEQFNKWCWVQRPFDDNKFYGTSPEEVISQLEQLAPAEQYMAQVSNAVTFGGNELIYYLMYPIGYYQGYKRLSNDYNPKSFNPTGSAVPIQFLNITGKELDGYIAVNGKWELTTITVNDRSNIGLNPGGKVWPDSIFMFTEKGNPNAVVGVYQMVATPDLGDRGNMTTIIIEPTD